MLWGGRWCCGLRYMAAMWKLLCRGSCVGRCAVGGYCEGSFYVRTVIDGVFRLINWMRVRTINGAETGCCGVV